MRTFYIFKINQEFFHLTYHKPYNLYMVLNGIYKSSVKDIGTAFSLFDSMSNLFKRSELEDALGDMYELDGYQNYDNKHTYHDYYKRESSKLVVYKSYLVLKTNYPVSIFLEKLNKIAHLFICDFQNNDYFWLCELMQQALVQ